MKQATEAIGYRRLLKLAAFLRTVPRRRFDYNTFVGEDWAGAQDLSCGTQACALGWAATMPAFRRLGLHLTRDGFPTLTGRDDPWRAACTLFGLGDSDVFDLFSPAFGEIEATPKFVARKIERFVKERRAA